MGTSPQCLPLARDADLDDSDVPKLGKSCWKAAELTMPEPNDRPTHPG